MHVSKHSMRRVTVYKQVFSYMHFIRCICQGYISDFIYERKSIEQKFDFFLYQFKMQIQIFFTSNDKVKLLQNLYMMYSSASAKKKPRKVFISSSQIRISLNLDINHVYNFSNNDKQYLMNKIIMQLKKKEYYHDHYQNVCFIL